MKKRKLSSVISDQWQPVGIGVIAIFALVALLTFRFNSIAHFVFDGELNVVRSSISNILSNPAFLHQQVLQKITFALTGNELYALRLPSLLNGVLGAFAFFWIVRLWFTRRIAVFASVLFVSSSWFLHVTRAGSTDSAYLLVLIPLLAAIFLRANWHSTPSAVVLTLSGLALLYVPGLLWLIIPALIWQRKLVRKAFRGVSPYLLGLLGLAAFLGILPLIIAIVQDPRFLLTVAALPQQLSSITSIPASFIDAFKQIFVSRSSNPLLGIENIPFVGYATAVLVLLGVFQLYQERKLERVKLLIAIVLIGALLYAISIRSMSVSFLQPFVYLLAGGGIAFLLRRWLTVFPKNSLAEKTAIVCLVLVVGTIASYELTRYFVAWPHSDGYTAASVRE